MKFLVIFVLCILLLNVTACSYSSNIDLDDCNGIIFDDVLSNNIAGVTESESLESVDETAKPLETADAPVSTFPEEETEQPTESTVPWEEETAVPLETTASDEEKNEPELPTHSKFYVDGVSVDQMIVYFTEVVLDSEFVNGGNPYIVQKWTSPIYYALHGSYSNDDMIKLNEMTQYLNSIEGFPGIYMSSSDTLTNFNIYFLNYDEYVARNPENGPSTDGLVTFWYNGASSIYRGEIFYRNDIDQYIRNSVILEEIYNGLGPAQDTDLRYDSLIYSGYSTPQHLTEVDKVIMELLYNPAIKCGMNSVECERVIRELYY